MRRQAQAGADDVHRRVVVIELVGVRRDAARGGPAVDLQGRAREARVRDEQAEGHKRRRVGAERVLGRDRCGPRGRHAQGLGDVGLVVRGVRCRTGQRYVRPLAHGDAEAGDEEQFLVVGDAVDDRHPGELPAGQGRSDRLGEHRAVHDAGNLDAEFADQVADWHVAQARRALVRAADGRGERLARGLGRGQRLLVQGERTALHDGPLEEPAGAGRDHLGQHRQAAG